MHWTDLIISFMVFFLITRSTICWYRTNKIRNVMQTVVYSPEFSYTSRIKYINEFEQVGWYKHFWQEFWFENAFNLYSFELVYFYFLEDFKARNV